jgi:transcriptional accessory protein Tex/SPT6
MTIKQKIRRVLKLIRTEKQDIPFITKYMMEDLSPHLAENDIWQIFNLDLEYGKFSQAKSQALQFFDRIGELSGDEWIKHYKR